MLILGGYGYTYRTADAQKEIVTKSDMDEYQKAMVKAVTEAIKNGGD